MDTTTTDGGADNAQPQESVAVMTGYNADQIISTDESGTPALVPVTSQGSDSADAPSEAVSEETPQETQAPEAAADKTDDEITQWSEKKGLKINPDNPNEVKLARMQLEAERKMHEANQIKSPINPPELLEETGNPDYDPLVERQNTLELKQYVRDWFDANPELKEHRNELQQIAQERPWLQNMDDVKAHFIANPSREAQLKKDGGREALTNLAQKQQQVPPTAGATNSGVYASNQITPSNVAQMVDSHDQAWFEKNHKAISAAMAGKTLN